MRVIVELCSQWVEGGAASTERPSGQTGREAGGQKAAAQQQSGGPVASGASLLAVAANGAISAAPPAAAPTVSSATLSASLSVTSLHHSLHLFLISLFLSLLIIFSFSEESRTPHWKGMQLLWTQGTCDWKGGRRCVCESCAIGLCGRCEWRLAHWTSCSSVECLKAGCPLCCPVLFYLLLSLQPTRFSPKFVPFSCIYINFFLSDSFTQTMHFLIFMKKWVARKCGLEWQRAASGGREFSSIQIGFFLSYFPRIDVSPFLFSVLPSSSSA